MGALFEVPVARVRDVARAPRPPRRARGPRRRSRSTRSTPDGDVTLVVGAEREGLPGRRGRGAATRSPTSRSARESLNAAMAATVALYELDRRMRARMIDRIAELRQQGEAAIAGRDGTAALEDVRVRFLGRKAELPNLLRGVAAAPARGARRRRPRRQRGAPRAGGRDRGPPRARSRPPSSTQRLAADVARRHAARHARRSPVGRLT